jgi:hypothetical protein
VVLAAIASAISSLAEKLGVSAQHLGAAPKAKAHVRETLPLGDALDNEVDGRYEPPPIEDARWRPPLGHADLNAR